LIRISYVRTMAAYNRWQNDSLFGAADDLSDQARRQPRGAFFGSIHGTLNHLLWGDQVWMCRFAGTPMPVAPSIATSVGEHEDWDDLKDARGAFDDVIEDWAEGLGQAWLDGEVSWHSSIAGCEVSRPAGFLVAHMFNHQTHHRGQVHAMLTAAGVKPKDTDLLLMEQR